MENIHLPDRFVDVVIKPSDEQKRQAKPAHTEGKSMWAPASVATDRSTLVPRIAPLRSGPDEVPPPSEDVMVFEHIMSGPCRARMRANAVVGDAWPQLQPDR